MVHQQQAHQEQQQQLQQHADTQPGQGPTPALAEPSGLWRVEYSDADSSAKPMAEDKVRPHVHDSAVYHSCTALHHRARLCRLFSMPLCRFAVTPALLPCAAIAVTVTKPAPATLARTGHPHDTVAPVPPTGYLIHTPLVLPRHYASP